MPTRKGDLYVSLPDPQLRQKIRQAAFDADTPIRFLVRDLLVQGLAARGYTLETGDASTQKAAAAAAIKGRGGA